jgi:cobalt-zinc-cadmium efflux system outer membrane protein
VLPEAQTALSAAQAALAEDGGSLLLLLEASRLLFDARLREVQAAADAQRALAELERSVGHRLECLQTDEGAEELIAPEPDMEVVVEATP